MPGYNERTAYSIPWNWELGIWSKPELQVNRAELDREQNGGAIVVMNHVMHCSVL